MKQRHYILFFLSFLFSLSCSSLHAGTTRTTEFAAQKEKENNNPGAYNIVWHRAPDMALTHSLIQGSAQGAHLQQHAGNRIYDTLSLFHCLVYRQDSKKAGPLLATKAYIDHIFPTHNFW